MRYLALVVALAARVCTQSGRSALEKMSTPTLMLHSLVRPGDTESLVRRTNGALHEFARLPVASQRWSLLRLVTEARSRRKRLPRAIPTPDVDLEKLDIIAIAAGKEPQMCNDKGEEDFLVRVSGQEAIAIKNGYHLTVNTFMGPGWASPAPGTELVCARAIGLIRAGYYDLRAPVRRGRRNEGAADAYSGYSLKRTEPVDGSSTTLIWSRSCFVRFTRSARVVLRDGSEYLRWRD